MRQDPLWVGGTCDRIMSTLIYWARNYGAGEPSATNKYLTKPGEMGPEPRLIEVVTRYACKVPWRKDDLEHLLRILEKFAPDHAVTRDLKINLPRWGNGILAKNQPGARIVTMDWYLDNIGQVYKILEAMRDGKTEESKPDLSTVDLSRFIQ